MRLFSILYTATLLLASALADEKGKVEVKTAAKRKTVYAHGRNSNDISNLLAAFKQCDHRGTIVLRGNQNYFLDRKLSLVVNDVTIEWRGTWTFRPDIDHWRQPANQYPIAFQNHVASFVLTGDGIRIDGYGTSMIEGSGDVCGYIKTWTGIPANTSRSESGITAAGDGQRSRTFSSPTSAWHACRASSTTGISLLAISKLAFVNFTGYLWGEEKANRTVVVSCEDVNSTVSQDSANTGTSSCSLIAPGGVHGISGSGCT